MFFAKIVLRWIWLEILVLILCIAGLLISFNSYVNKPAMVETMGRYLTLKTHLPFSLESLHWGLAQDISMDNCLISGPAPFQESPLFKCAHIEANYYPWYLPLNRLKIMHVRWVSPEVTLHLDSHSKFLFPVPNETPAQLMADLRKQKIPDFIFNLIVDPRFFFVESGQLHLVNADGNSLLEAKEISLDDSNSIASGSLSSSGQLHLSSLNVLGWTLTEAQSRFTIEQGSLKFNSFTAQSYHGNLNGSLNLRMVDSHLPYELNLNADQLDVNQFVGQFLGQPEAISGEATFNSSWRGVFGGQEGPSGKANFTIINGELVQVPFFQQLSQSIGVRDLAQPDVSKCQGSFSVENHQITLSSFLLNSTLFDLNATGTIGLDGTLNLDCVMNTKPDLVKALPANVLHALSTNADGSKALSFHLSGTFSQPTTDLWTRVLVSSAQ